MCADPGARTPIGASGNFCILLPYFKVQTLTISVIANVLHIILVISLYSFYFIFYTSYTSYPDFETHSRGTDSRTHRRMKQLTDIGWLLQLNKKTGKQNDHY